MHLLGTSGTVTTLAGIHLKLPRYDRRQVDGVWMNSADVDRMIDELVAMDFDARTRNPWPKKIVWHQSGRTHERFYWLAVPNGTARLNSCCSKEAS